MPQLRHMKSSILLTGASGFLGRRLLERMAERAGRIVSFGNRKPAVAGNSIEFVPGDLLDSGRCRQAVTGCETIVHLAAATGKHRRAEYFRVNRDGTQVLLQQAHEAGVKRFLYISTIAVNFADKFRYHYAESKQQAEALVRNSVFNWTIIRPTMIFGAGSPVQAGFERLAMLPIVPVFGDGRVLVQPILVDDAADLILDILDSNAFDGRTVEAGGPERLTIEDLLQRMRRAAGLRNYRAVHLPLKPLSLCLAAMEPVFGPLLPITAGQLASFRNSGTAAPDECIAARAKHMRGVDEMLLLR
jgi:nucleoside-diphosphate-sugar epimerase